MIGGYQRASVVLAAAASLLALTGQANGACECGYQDPITGDLWTDATITYFNETGMADIITDLAQPPSIYGEDFNGVTGDGQQAWSVIGNHVDDWEDSFGATYRDAVSYNNTFIQNQEYGLAMQVSVADFQHHIVNGSQMVTRRRDIQYGSFRAYILPASSFNLNGGSAFTFGVSYNESETVDLSLYTSTYGNNNHTLQWSFSATGKDATPVPSNLSYADPGTNELLGLEHRIDWQSSKRIALSNNGGNSTANHISYVKGENATNLPTSAAPVSFQTWSNGEPSASMGPPQVEPAITQILYARFFYNSTRPERGIQFTQQCQASMTAMCSTDDYTLRNSTVFDLAATGEFHPATAGFHLPLYAIIVESIIGGLILILVIHVLVTRRYFGNTGKGKAGTTGPLLRRKDVKLPPASSDEYNETVITYESWKQGLESKNASSTHIAESLLLAKNSPYAQSIRAGRRTSSFGQSSSIGQGTMVNSSSKLSLPHYSSRPSSIILGQNSRNRASAPRDITDLDNFFDGFDSDSGYDSDDYAQAQRISGAFERRAIDDDEAEDEAENWAQDTRLNHEVEILPHFVSEGNNTVQETESNQKEDSRTPSPLPQIVQWQVRNEDQSNNNALAGQLAEPKEVSDALPVKQGNLKSRLAHYPTIFQLIVRRIDNYFFVSRTQIFTSSGQRRIDYLDGMRGLACLMVSMGHFLLIFYPGISNSDAPHHYPRFEMWFRYILGPITSNASLLLGIFFALPARTMCQRYLLKGGLGSLADVTVRRIPRLMVPVTAAALINYFLMDVNAFKWVQRLASRTWSVWSYWQSYDNVLVFTNAVVTLCWGSPPANPALVTGYATGVLWTIPVIVQGMWTCMIASVIAHEIKKTWKRFSFYFLAVLFSWYANTWDCFFLTGLIVGDLDSNLRYREKAAKGIPLPIPSRIIPSRLLSSEGQSMWVRLHGKWLVWAYFLACVTQQYIAYIPTAPGNFLTYTEQNIHPDWTTAEPRDWNGAAGWTGYSNPSIWGFFLILGLFMVADMSPVIQKFFRLRVWHWLGIHSMSVYLLHGAIWWTWDAWLCLTMLKNGAPYWGAVLTCFFTGYILLFLLCICFTYTFEVWATLFAKAVWRATSGNLGRKV